MEKSQCIIFYSWQSDLPNKTNRGFIQDALEKAAETLRSDASIEVEPVIDRDVAGIPGSPDITKTIFGKIEQAQVFVCDISIINQDAMKLLTVRPIPNPNVLIELGYALHALGDKCILLLLNDAYGNPKLLPFDLNTRHAIVYHMPAEAEDRSTERNRLVGILTDALRTILNEVDKPLPGVAIEPLSLTEQVKVAIETNRPNQASLARKYMIGLAERIANMTPTFLANESSNWDEQLVQAIQESTDMVIEFAQVAEFIAQMNANEAARVMYKGFSNILNLYTLPPDIRGSYHECDFDLAKFLGHELFVTLFAFLLQEERWELIANLLDENLYARIIEFSPPTSAPSQRISTYIRLLDSRNNRLKLQRLSLHFDLLSERHTKGDISKIVPLAQFVDADYFLFLRAELQNTSASRSISWIPWSVLGMQQTPFYLQEAIRIKYAQHLLQSFGVEDLPTLRTRLQERAGKVAELWRNGFWHYPMARFDFSTIGTQ
ncbi:MAG: hypothetical protein ACYDER_20485 [Ktedonobacteraceae bacterium]